MCHSINVYISLDMYIFFVSVYTQATKSQKLTEIIVATDDERIGKVCIDLNIPLIMTGQHTTAANRMWEISEKVVADFYVGVNGDEPLIDSVIIDATVPGYVPQHIEFGTNIITDVVSAAEVMDPSNIKVVFDCNMNALYMSRNPIPQPFRRIDFKYYKHVGVLGYNKKMLDFYNASEPGNFESIEGIDTLRFLDYGKKLQLIYVPQCKTLSVDTPKDLNIVKNMVIIPAFAAERRCV